MVGRRPGGRRAVFFDRDGVLNQAKVLEGRPYPPDDAESAVLTEQAPELLAALKDKGFFLFAVTNQPDAARGKTTVEKIQAINQKIQDSLPLDGLRTCFHDRQDQCRCRKPQPGLILDLARDYDIDLAGSFIVGDRASDVEAGRRAGVKTVFLDFAYNEPGPDQPPDFTCRSLAEAVRRILEGE
ncbi:MAG: HAD-IIIA family hydrolase [Deltaproteobacteria bacterium]|jgi:D-glycero-D-manno-heptose 1,7-bisphosphate phosphatase|nr:HAD-IIIA family hydrolase [Deltaproteobacteria bacterium]